MSQLELTNIINISVSAAPAGLGQYNTSNIALFTRDTPGGGFGDDGFKIYKSPSEVTTDFGSGSATSDMAIAVFSQKPNILTGGGYLVVIPFVDSDEDLGEALTRTKDLVQYFGVISTEIMSSVPLLAAAAIIQTLNKILFVVSKTAADVNSGGLLDLLRTGGLTQTRGLLYIGEGVDRDSLNMMAAYSGRALSTDFNGSNTTQTMHLKDLITIQPDSSMTQTILQACALAGADIYASFQGVPKVFTSGANHFFDQVYNLQWLVGALQVAGFNALARTSSKLPQTEAGVGVLTSAYRSVLEQSLVNQYVAPGAWNSPDTFGNLGDFIRNIEERGYYIYSLPVALQSQASRDDREAPLIQIALKEAGAIHSSDVIVNINA